MRTGIMLVLVLSFGCGSTTEENIVFEAEGEATRSITLTRGDKISIRVATDGSGLIRVTIVDGKPDAGTYTTTADVLFEPARNAKNMLNEPGTAVSIQVDSKNEIVSISHRRKI